MTVQAGQYDPKLGRIRTHTDDFYDHRKIVLSHIQDALEQEKKKGKSYANVHYVHAEV